MNGLQHHASTTDAPLPSDESPMTENGDVDNDTPYETPVPIKSIPLDGFDEFISRLGQPSYRKKQLLTWIYVRGVSSYDEMTDLPKSLRSMLEESHPLVPTKTIDRQISSDGTRKYVLELSDGTLVETVGIPSQDSNDDGTPKRLTVCFSTQAGCPMGCVFCATGHTGFSRNLHAAEMIDQVLAVQNDFGTRVSHLVVMGQGEPFLNYKEVMAALHFMNAKSGLGIGARHITVSTCGIVDGIELLSNENKQYTLAVSLHSARQNRRNDLMPGCRNQPLAQLKSSLIDYQNKTGRRVSFEYSMMRGINDGEQDLEALIDFCRGLSCHVNLIPLNPINYLNLAEGSPNPCDTPRHQARGSKSKDVHLESSPFASSSASTSESFQLGQILPSTSKTMRMWLDTLSQNRIETTTRNSRGTDIDGACGQLANKTRKTQHTL